MNWNEYKQHLRDEWEFHLRNPEDVLRLGYVSGELHLCTYWLTPELSDGGTKMLRLQLRRNPAVRWSDMVRRQRMKTIFKYRDKYWREYVLLFRVGSMPTATQILENCDDATPENATLQHQLARIGCRLHRKGEYVPKKQHEQETINVA